MSTPLFHDLLKHSNNKDSYIVAEKEENLQFIDTGSYTLNALISADIFGGIPQSRVTAFAGEESTGKSFLVLSVAKHFLEKNPTGSVLYFETEGALTQAMIEDRGIDSNRIAILPVDTIQNFRHQMMSILDTYLSKTEKQRAENPIIFVLDSLGMLSTNKEIEDIVGGKDTRDMTRAQLIRGTFRALLIKLTKANLPLIITNHTYQAVTSFFPTKEMSGGGGIKYSASNIIFLGRSKDKDDKTKPDVQGSIIKCLLNKGRFTKENKRIETRILYGSGLDRYYGLVVLAEEAGIFTKEGNKWNTPGGSAFEKAIYKNPEKYFTSDVLDKINDYVKEEFAYGKASIKEEGDEEIDTETGEVTSTITGEEIDTEV